MQVNSPYIAVLHIRVTLRLWIIPKLHTIPKVKESPDGTTCQLLKNPALYVKLKHFFKLILKNYMATKKYYNDIRVTCTSISSYLIKKIIFVLNKQNSIILNSYVTPVTL